MLNNNGVLLEKEPTMVESYNRKEPTMVGKAKKGEKKI
jgi:hypothetical protein